MGGVMGGAGRWLLLSLSLLPLSVLGKSGPCPARRLGRSREEPEEGLLAAAGGSGACGGQRLPLLHASRKEVCSPA